MNPSKEIRREFEQASASYLSKPLPNIISESHSNISKKNMAEGTSTPTSGEITKSRPTSPLKNILNRPSSPVVPNPFGYESRVSKIKFDDILPLIPIFCGRKSEYLHMRNNNTAPGDYVEAMSFIEHIERYVTDPKMRVMVALKRSAGPAHQVLLRLVPKNQDWEEFKGLLIQVYSEITEEHIYRKIEHFRMSGREPGDTFISWYLRKIAESEAILKTGIVKSGFNQEFELKMVVMRFCPSKIWEKLRPLTKGWDRARELDRQIRLDPSLGIPEVAIRKETYGISEDPIPYVANINPEYEHASPQVSSNEHMGLMAVVDKLSEKVEQLAAIVHENRGARKTPRACFSCGKQGHFAKDCNPNRQSYGPKKCYNCGKLGHLARDCWAERPRPQRTSFRGNCHKCGKRGHMARICRAQSTNHNSNRQMRGAQNNNRYGGQMNPRQNFRGQNSGFNGMRNARNQRVQGLSRNRVEFGSSTSIASKN